MAWTAPSATDYAVGEIVTAAKLNSNVANNLRYLKGLDGAVQIDNELDVVQAAGATIAAQGTNNSAFARFRLLGKDGGGSVADWRVIADGGAGGIFTIYGGVGVALDNRFTIATNGNVAIGNHTPQGKLHTKGAIGNWTMWEFDGLAGVAQTVLPISSASFAQAGWALVRDTNSGLTQTTVLTASPLSTITIGNFNAGADVVQLQVASGGFTVVRTVGSHVYKVVIFLLTL